MICKEIIKNYLSHLQKSFIVKQTELGCHIITPFMAFNGEPINFYIEEIPGGLRLTDAGNTLMDLKTIHIDVDSGKEEQVYSEILHLYEVGEQDNEIIVDTSLEQLADRLILYINGLQALYNMEYLTIPSRKKTFHQTVHDYCETNELKHKYMQKIKVGDVEDTIDIMSIDFKNLIQTMGIVAEFPQNMKAFAEKKLFIFMKFEIPKYISEKEKYKRIIIFDESINWDNQCMSLMEDFSDKLITWNNTKKEKELEKLLTI